MLWSEVRRGIPDGQGCARSERMTSASANPSEPRQSGDNRSGRSSASYCRPHADIYLLLGKMLGKMLRKKAGECERLHLCRPPSLYIALKEARDFKSVCHVEKTVLYHRCALLRAAIATPVKQHPTPPTSDAEYSSGIRRRRRRRRHHNCSPSATSAGGGCSRCPRRILQ